MRQKRPPRPKPGDAITAKWANDLVDHIERNAPEAGPGLVMRQSTKGGTVISLSATFVTIAPGIVGMAGITARSGTTPGSGDVGVYTLLASGPTIVATGNTVTVYSISSTSGGVAASTYVMIGLDQAGVWWLLSVDCG